MLRFDAIRVRTLPAAVTGFSTNLLDSPHETRVPPESADPSAESPGWLRMRYKHPPLRLGMTAIAAVLALSATQLLAQSADTSAADASTPVLVTPPPVASTPVTAAPSTMSAPAVTATVSPSASSVSLESVAADINSGSTSAAPPSRPAHVATVKTAAPVAATAVAAAARPPMVAPKVSAPASAPVVKAMPTAAPSPAPNPQPVAKTPSNDGKVAVDETLPMAGVAGAALLVLAGGAYAATRRRRNRDEAYVVDEPTTV